MVVQRYKIRHGGADALLSYARHDYFRRIFCNMVGAWVENGEYPDAEESLKKIVEGVSYKNAARYFSL